jgi:asparagine synthase (glutamine-hydrolysing)
MCGITGLFAFNLIGKMNMIHLANATMALARRGPDFQDMYHDTQVGLGHRRLSVIDTSEAAHQPMWDPSKRYAIVFNGEIFNYRELRNQLEANGASFVTQSDTEVLLQLYMRDKEQCLHQLNGFFAFCIYDKQEQTFFLARDRFGVKPLLYLFDEDKFIFASEMKSMLRYGIDRGLDYTALYTYLQLNYIPAPNTIFKTVRKVMPGQSVTVSRGQMKTDDYYEIPVPSDAKGRNPLTYEQAKNTFRDLLEASVQRRLVADVPLGTFLSGGIDSSVITGLAKKHRSDLHTFSIGFRDEKFFDETNYARLVANHFTTEHTVFSLSNADLYEHVHDILTYIDEPFADSSAINVYILSKHTRKHATVTLSGDGADELLGGYNKHAAHLRAIQPGWKENIAATLLPLWKSMPQSRNNPLANKARQLTRFAEGMRQTAQERYWRWAGYTAEDNAIRLLSAQSQLHLQADDYRKYKSSLLQTIQDPETINAILLTDTKLVLPNDMLTKVDLMSMANSLEVRTPFLDVELVNFIFSLPDDFKINASIRKRILQDTFRDFLPPALYNRPKKGFEVPLLKWFRREMKAMIMDDLLSEKVITEQGIFDYAEVQKLKRQLFSSNPGDVHARIWGLVVFQYWWRAMGIQS